MKIVFTGGGTGGHIFPIVAICRQLRKIYSKKEKLELFYLGPKDNYVFELFSQEQIKVKTILSGKLRRYFSLKNFFDLFKIPIGIFQSFFWLFIWGPDIVFSKGGYGSLPVVLSAKILQIPFFLHESDSLPGLASKIESKWALEIFTSFPKTEGFDKKKIIWVGNPIREELMNGSAEQAKKIFNLQGDKPLILILGGSQGSQKINEVVLEILPEMLKNFEVVHQVGKKHYRNIKAESQVILSKNLKKYYHIFPFLNENQLKHILKACQIVVSRGGSGTLFEIAANKKPVLIIPLSTAAQNHQLKNAYVFSAWGGGEVIEEENFSPHFFLERLKYFLSRKDILEEMSENCWNFAKPKAAQIIASYLIEYLKQSLV